MFATIALLLTLSTTAAPLPTTRESEVDLSFFHDRLATSGTWTRHAKYGWVWFPDEVEVGWRPYTHGHWVYGTEGSWLWDSEDEWGWATDHYGRWAFDEELGWIWVPGTDWAPAWVAWRSGEGYVGWAPLPPGASFVGGELEWGPLGIDAVIEPVCWVFVEEHSFCHPHLSQVVLPRLRNLELCPRTRDITRVSLIEGRPHDRSLSVETIEAATGERVERIALRDVDSASAASPRLRIGDGIAVFRPRVRPTTAVPPGPQDLDRIHAARVALLRERQALELSQHEAWQHRSPLDESAKERKDEELARAREQEQHALEEQRTIHRLHERESHQLEARRKLRTGKP